MSTFYLDPVNGNDANDGLGWYKAAFTSGGTYEIKAGDTVTDDTTAKTALVISVVVDSGTWAGGDAAGTLYVCAPTGAFTESGTISVGANSNVATLTADFAVNSWKTWTNGATAARIAPGDTIKIAKSPDEVSSGVNGTFTNASKSITLSAALTKEICNCDSAWTASANVTDANSSGSLYKTEGTYCRKFTIASGFDTGKIAYFDLGESKDFSAYQKISLTMTASADKAAGIFQVCLCSDATGDTPVNSLTVNQPLSYATTVVSVTYLTLNNGSALGDSIRSVAIYALSDPGAISLYVDNIIACNDFSLNSLVGKQGEAWWPIKAITSDTTVVIGSGVSGYDMEFCGVTETVPLYYRNPIPATSIALDSTTVIETITDSGTAGNLITYSGGWDSSTGAQTGMTIYDALCSFGYGIYSSNKSYIRIEKLGIVRAYVPIYYSGTIESTGNEFSDLLCSGNVGGLSTQNSYRSIYNYSFNGDINLVGNGWGLSISERSFAFSSDKNSIIRIIGCLNGGTGNMVCYLQGRSHKFDGELIIAGNSAVAGEIFGMYHLVDTYIRKITLTGKCTFVFATYSTDYITGIHNVTIGELELSTLNGNSVQYLFGMYTSCRNFRIATLILNGNTVSHFLYNYVHDRDSSFFIDTYGASNRWFGLNGYGYISDQITGGQNAAWAYGGEGTCLYLDPQSQTYPTKHIFYCPVTAGTTYQIHFQVKKTSAAANCTLEIDRISGCGITEIKDESVSLTDSWAEHTSASFTPTYSGYVRCELHALDGSTTGDIGIDDIHLATV